MSSYGLDTALIRSVPAIQRLSDKITATTAAQSLTTEYLLPFGQWFIASPWRCYGIGPIVAVFLGLMLNTFILEWLTAQSWMQQYLITYGRETRAEAVKKTQDKVPWKKQFMDTLWQVGGPTNFFGCVAMRYLMEYVHGGSMPSSPLPTLFAFVLDFLLMGFIADFFLMVGHRIQHEVTWNNGYLWHKSHAYHHRLATPTSAGTAYIEDLDAFLQSAIPLLLTAIIVAPHPITHVCYLFHHLQNNALNHSGIGPHWFFDFVTLKFLPFRCKNNFHDAHHKFSGQGKGKNYGEWTWIWDWLFGTYSMTHEVMTRKRN